MKKTTIAAAKKAAKKAVKKTAVKKTVAKTAPAKVAAKKAAAPKPALEKVASKSAAPAAAKKSAAVAKADTKTTIVANVDIGFGNTLFLRGDAPGLSWSEGVPMDCQNGDSWSIVIAGVSEAFEFKVLINDSFWSSGYNHSATPGSTITIQPQF